MAQAVAALMQVLRCAGIPALPLLASATFDWLWAIGAVAVQAAVGLTCGVVGALIATKVLKARVDAQDKRLDSHAGELADLRERIEKVGTESIVHDGRIERTLLSALVPKSDCHGWRDQQRQTATRLFARVEDLQKGQAAMSQATDDIRTSIRGINDALARLAGPSGDRP